MQIIQSKHRHDFVSCTCGSLFVDGGGDYLRMGLYAGNLGYTNLDAIVEEDTIKENSEDDGFIV